MRKGKKREKAQRVEKIYSKEMHKHPTRRVNQYTRTLTLNMERSVRDLVYQTMDPTNADMYRLPTDGSSFQSVGTALSKNYKAFHLDFSLPFLTSQDGILPFHGGAHVRNYISDTSYYPVVVLRDPVVSFIDVIANNDGGAVPAVQVAIYTSKTVMALAGGNGTYEFYGNGATTWLYFNDFEFASGHTHYGEYIVTGTMALGGSLVWVDAGTAAAGASATLKLLFDSVTGKSSKFIVWLYRVLNDNNRVGLEYFTVTEDGATGHYTAEVAIEECGYYQIGFTITDNCGVNFGEMALTQRANCITRHHVTDAYDTAADQVEELRVLGQSILLSNVTAQVNLQGTVYAVNMVQEHPWYEYLADMDKMILSSNLGLRYQGHWDKGFYGYVKPNRPGAMELVSTYIPIDDVRFSAFRPFRNLGSFVALVTRATSPVAGSGSPNSVTLMATRIIEFTTSSQMYAVQPVTAPVQAYEGYVNAMRDAEMFFENPLHFKDIAAFAKRAASAVGSFALHTLLPAMAAKAASAIFL